MKLSRATVEAVADFIRLPISSTSPWDRVSFHINKTLKATATCGTSVLTIVSTDEHDFAQQLRLVVAGARRMQIMEDEEGCECRDGEGCSVCSTLPTRPLKVRTRRTPEEAVLECDDCDADPGEPCDCGTEEEVNAHLGANWIELDPEQDRMGLRWVSETVRRAFLTRLKKLQRDRLRVYRKTTKGTSRCTMSQCRDLGSGRYLHVGTGKGMWYRGRQVNVTWKETLVHYIEHHGFCPPPEFREAIDALMNHKKPVPTKRDKP